MSALDDLITNLQTIHTETMDKIIPENIRAGVTIFGVTGTYDGTDSESEVESVTSD